MSKFNLEFTRFCVFLTAYQRALCQDVLQRSLVAQTETKSDAHKELFRGVAVARVRRSLKLSYETPIIDRLSFIGFETNMAAVLLFVCSKFSDQFAIHLYQTSKALLYSISSHIVVDWLKYNTIVTYDMYKYM